MVLGISSAFTNPDKAVPARIRSLHRLGQKGFRRAMAFAYSGTNREVPVNDHLGAELNKVPCLRTRQSVLSLTSLTAWNRLSMVSITDIEEGEIEYRLHQPSIASLGSNRSSASAVRASKTDIESSLSDAAAFELAAAVHGIIPLADRFPALPPALEPIQSWDDFVDRVLELAECRPEPLCPLRPVGSRPPSHNQDPNPSGNSSKGSEEEDWFELERTVLRKAQVLRQTAVKVVKKGEVKLVNLTKPKIRTRKTTLIYEEESFQDDDMTLATSIMHTLGKIVTKVRSAEGLKHDALPYQAYSPPFDPFNDSETSTNTSPTSSLSKSERRECSIFQSSGSIELHLPPPTTIVTPPTPTCPTPATGPINQTSWFDNTGSKPVAAFHAVPSGETATMQGIHNSALPFSRRESVHQRPHDDRRFSCPERHHEAADTTFSSNDSKDSGVSERPAAFSSAVQRPASVDLSTGLLSRHDTLAAERNTPGNVNRTVMNQSYPTFLKRSAVDYHDETSPRKPNKLIKRAHRESEKTRPALPTIRESNTPTTLAFLGPHLPHRKDPSGPENGLRPTPPAVPAITVTAPSLTATDSVRSAALVPALPNPDRDTDTDAAIGALLAATVSAPVRHDTARVSVGDLISASAASAAAAAAPAVPLGPAGAGRASASCLEARRSLIRRRPVPLSKEEGWSGHRGHREAGHLCASSRVHGSPPRALEGHHPSSFACRVVRRMHGRRLGAV